MNVVFFTQNGSLNNLWRGYFSDDSVKFTHNKKDFFANLNDEVDEIVPTELELYKPLEIDEALNKLKESTDQFLVFNDMDAKMRVLYKRKDGKFGLF